MKYILHLLLLTTLTLSASSEILKIKLNATSLELPEGNSTQLSVRAYYDNNTSKDVTPKVTWSIDNPQIASIDTNATLNAIQEGLAQITAELENITSQTLSLSVVKVINGHKLPPEPDPDINNATLLGVDVNNNGVRDDVERWIYETYKDKHPVYIDIAMQAGRAYKKVLETPEKALEIHDEVGAAQYCQYYYMYDAKYFNEPILINNSVITKTFIKKIYFNTDKRLSNYLLYDKLLSGGVYTLPEDSEEKSYCDFNTSKYEE